MFYRIKENKLYDWANYKYSEECLYTDIITVKELEEHPNKVIVENGELVLNPDFGSEQAKAREANFNSQFFYIEGVGYYRKQPKGYSSALESVNTAFNAVTILGILPANTLTFYQAPDFANKEECTEEWLVANSFKNEVMTAEEFGQFYASFITAWNEQEHL